MAKPKNKLNFTHTALKVLPPSQKGKRAVYFDDQVKGLNIIVTDNGSKSFYVRKVIKGQSKRIRLGAFPDLSVKNARDMALEVKSAVAKGKDPHRTAKQEKEEPTFRSFFYSVFVEKHGKSHKKTYEYDIKSFERHINPVFGKEKLSNIQNQDIRGIHQKIGQTQPYAANKTIALIRVVFNKAIEWGYLKKENPALFIKPFKEKSRDRFLQRDELPCFFEALNEELSENIKDYIWLSLLTGARKMNVLSMRWQDISIERKEWRIPETKNGEPQIIPLVDQVLDIIRRRKAELQAKDTKVNLVYVFPSKGASGHMMEPRRGWKRVCQSGTIKL